MTIAELYEEAVKMRLSLMTYSLLWAMQQGKIESGDYADKLKSLELDKEAIDSLMNTDPLQLERIKAYAFMYVSGVHQIVLAESESQAKYFMAKRTRLSPIKIFDVTNRMHIDFWNPELGANQSINDVYRSVYEFPHYVFELDLNEPTLEELENEYYRTYWKRS